MAHVAWFALAFLWLVQFVAWRRAVVAKEQLELVAEQLEQVRSLARHPVYRNEKLAGWVRSAESC